MLLNSGTAAGGGRSALRNLNDENAGFSNKQGKDLEENSYSTRKAKNVRLALAPKSENNNAGGSKTPAQSQRRRRALGDISNRKPSKSQGGGGGGKAGGTSKARSVSFQTPGRTGKVPASTQRTPFASKVGATKGSAKEAKNRPVLTPHHSRVPSGRDDLLLPQRSVSVEAGQKPDAAAPKSRPTSDTPKTVLEYAEQVEDVELPAGRLWDGNADFFDDDELNGSFEQLRGAQDDVDAIRQNQREANQRAYEKYLVDSDAALAEKMEKVAFEDYEYVMGGMDKLIDEIDGDFNDDPILHPSFERDIVCQRHFDDDFHL